MKDTPKASKPKQNINWRKAIKKFIARPAAFGVLVLTSAYGIKQMLDSLEEGVATILTVLFVLALCYILSDLD